VIVRKLRTLLNRHEATALEWSTTSQEFHDPNTMLRRRRAFSSGNTLTLPEVCGGLLASSVIGDGVWDGFPGAMTEFSPTSIDVFEGKGKTGLAGMEEGD